MQQADQVSSPRTDGSFLLLLAGALGLSAGVMEAALLGAKKYILGHYIMFSGTEVTWMAPVTNAVVLLCIAIVLVALRSLAGKSVMATSVFLLVFIAAASVLLRFSNLLNVYAILLLAAGVAVQFARLILRYPRVARRTACVLTPLLLIAVTATAAGLAAAVASSERREVASLPAARTGAPNVLLIVLDTVRAASLSPYHYDRDTTPFLGTLAARGVTFDLACSTAPWTLASHATMFTGRTHEELGVNWMRPMNRLHLTLAEAMRDNGYHTAGFVANTIYCTRESGLDRGFAHFEDYTVSPGQFAISSALVHAVADHAAVRRAIGRHELLARKKAPHVNASFLAWLDRRRSAADTATANGDALPFFAFLNYFDAHNPYLPPPPYDTRFTTTAPARDPLLLDNVNWKWTPAQAAAERDAYDGMLAYLDDHLRQLWTGLESRGLLENTIVIVTSDHGEEFCEHGVMGHGNSLYLNSVRVPLFFWGPARVPADRRVATPVSLGDLPATVMDLAGLDETVFPGRSLARRWSSNGNSDPDRPVVSELTKPGEVPAWFPIAKGNMQAVIAHHRRRYIRNGDNSVELYDLNNDEGESRNLATPASSDELLKLTEAAAKPSSTK